MNEALRGLIAKWRSLGKQNKEAPFAFTIFNRFADELEAALASQPEQAPFPLSDIEIEKVIAKIRPVVDSEFINRIHPNAQTQTNLVLTALKQVLEERVAAPAPAEEARTPFDPRDWIMHEMATEQIPEMWLQQLVARAYAAGQAAKGGREA